MVVENGDSSDLGFLTRSNIVEARDTTTLQIGRDDTNNAVRERDYEDNISCDRDMASTSVVWTEPTEISLPPRLAPADLSPTSYRISRFREELEPDIDDVEVFEKLTDTKRLSDQGCTSREAPVLPPEPMRRVTDWPSTGTLPTRMVAPRRLSNVENHSWESASRNRRLSRDAQQLPPVSTRRAIYVHSIRPLTPANSDTDIYIGRMVLEDNYPFSQLEYKTQVDAFCGMKRWSWYDKSTSGSGAFNIDPNWDNAKKDLANINTADEESLAITSGYGVLFPDLERRDVVTEISREARNVERKPSSPHMGIDLHNAPMVIRHLELENAEMTEFVFEPQGFAASESDSIFDGLIAVEEGRDQGDQQDEGYDGHGDEIRTFDCAAALNGEMTFLVSDSEEEGEAVSGAYPSGKLVHVSLRMDSMEGGFF